MFYKEIRNEIFVLQVSHKITTPKSEMKTV